MGRQPVPAAALRQVLSAAQQLGIVVIQRLVDASELLARTGGSTRQHAPWRVYQVQQMCSPSTEARNAHALRRATMPGSLRQLQHGF
jgi:hypothetical protein